MAFKPKPTVAPADAQPGQGQPRPPSVRPPGGIKVRATQVCYYDDKRRRVGDVFLIQDEQEFSARYMEKVDDDTPERVTTGKDYLRQQHDEILGAKMGGQPLPSGPRPNDKSIDPD